MTKATLKLDLVNSILIEQAIEAKIKSTFKFYRKLQDMKRGGVNVAPAQFENRRFYVSELNKQRRILKAANAV